MSLPDFWDDSASAATVRSQLGPERDASGRIYGFGGTVCTTHGLVSVQGAPASPGQRNGYTLLDFAYAGRWHRRTYNRCLTKRGAAIAAGRFAREIAGDDR